MSHVSEAKSPLRLKRVVIIIVIIIITSTVNSVDGLHIVEREFH